MLRHPRGGQRIADGILQRLAWLAGDLQQSTMISGIEDRKLRTTLQLLSGAVSFTVLQQYEDPGVELWNQAFERCLHVRKGPPGLDLDVFDLYRSRDDDRIRHKSPHTAIGAEGSDDWLGINGSRSAGCLLDRGPDLLRRERHVEMRDAEWRQRIEHGVHDRRRCADRAALADPLHSERIGGGRSLLELRSEGRE